MEEVWEPEPSAYEEVLTRDADREQWVKRIQKKHERLKILYKSEHSEVWQICRKKQSESKRSQQEEERERTKRRHKGRRKRGVYYARREVGTIFSGHNERTG